MFIQERTNHFGVQSIEKWEIKCPSDSIMSKLWIMVVQWKISQFSLNFILWFRRTFLVFHPVFVVYLYCFFYPCIYSELFFTGSISKVFLLKKKDSRSNDRLQNSVKDIKYNRHRNYIQSEIAFDCCYLQPHLIVNI